VPKLVEGKAEGSSEDARVVGRVITLGALVEYYKELAADANAAFKKADAAVERAQGKPDKKQKSRAGEATPEALATAQVAKAKARAIARELTGKATSIPSILEIVASSGSQEGLQRALHSKYGRLPRLQDALLMPSKGASKEAGAGAGASAGVGAGAGNAGVATEYVICASQLVAFYEEHEPAKIANVSALLAQVSSHIRRMHLHVPCLPTRLILLLPSLLFISSLLTPGRTQPPPSSLSSRRCTPSMQHCHYWRRCRCDHRTPKSRRVAAAA
jgi:hypothetical protein